MKDQKERLLEVMEKVNPSFKRINELGAKMAGVAINRNLGGDERTKQISKDAITSLFNKYIGRDIPFFMKIRDTDKPTKFELIEVTFGRDMSMQQEYSSLENGGNYVLKLHFYNANGEESDAPYAENKKEMVLEYELATDKFRNAANQYFYNQYAINLLLYAVLIIRKVYFSAFPVRKQLSDDEYKARGNNNIDQAATEERMKTRLNKRSFQQFSYDSNNLENRSNIKPEPNEEDYF